MKKIGIMQKSDSKTVFCFPAKSVRLHQDYSDSSIYIAYEITENTYEEAYSWTGSEVVFDDTYTPPSPPIEEIAATAVNDAIKFGDRLIKEFASENVAMGITQLGKTAEVLSLMESQVEFDPINKPNIKISVIGTINSGSLYEAISVIDHHIEKATNGDYNHLSPFITENRLTQFKYKIIDYLT